MESIDPRAPDEADRRAMRCHIALLVLVSAAYEALFLRPSLSLFDEGWPLYAARRVLEGGTLYRDVFFVFPPGHLLPALLGEVVAPPGVLASRVLYAALTVALCVTLYLLGRRLMPPGFAFLGALLAAVAAPESHYFHHLFAYRYLLFGATALLAFDAFLRSGDRRWMVAAGALTGLALWFRLTPAVAAAGAIAVGLLASGASPRRCLEAGLAYAAGLLLGVGPGLAWFAHSVGLDVLWREAVVRPIAMTALQAQPVPPLVWPASASAGSVRAFVQTLQFRLWPALYMGCLVALAVEWVRARRVGRPFGHALALAGTVFGAIYLGRAYGRADAAHLDSTLPPVCMVLAGLLSLPFRGRLGELRGRALALAAGSAALLVWVLALGSWEALRLPFAHTVGVRATLGRVLLSPGAAQYVDAKARFLRRRAAPGQTVLIASEEIALHVLSRRDGPGGHDVIVPGTFLGASEEEGFVARLRRRPPAIVVWPRADFDGDPSRSFERTAPRVAAWVREHYQTAATDPLGGALLVPRASAGPARDPGR